MQLIYDLLFIILAFTSGYFISKSQIDTKEIQKKLKRLKKPKGEVIKPKTAEEIRKENEKRFYESIR